jgi:hypothetical protein
MYRFVLDPIAEFLTAEAYCDEFGNDEDCWERLARKSANAPGFQRRDRARAARPDQGMDKGVHLEGCNGSDSCCS